MNLEIELFRYRELLFGRVLHMDEGLRDNVKFEHDGFSIKSSYRPSLISTELYVRGSNLEDDDLVFSYAYRSEREAIATGEKIVKAIWALNNKLAIVSSPIERLI